MFFDDRVAGLREKMEAWRSYNEYRPDGKIGHKPPISLHSPGGITGLSP